MIRLSNFAIACLLACLPPVPALAGAHRLLPTGVSAGDQPISLFYRWNKRIPKLPGKILRKEAFPQNLAPRQASIAIRILYSTSDVRWRSGILPASGVLYLPRGLRPARGWPLVVWNHGTVGVADSCAPSWTGPNPRDRAYVARWLDEGYAVVAPDYQGLGGPGPHPYLDWRSEGRSSLDAARAVIGSTFGISNRIVLTGQSQGSGATLGAARLAASYAPGLKVRGAIATALVTTFPASGAPVDEPPPGGAPYFLIYRIMTGGLPIGSPPAQQLLSAKGRILLEAARTRCDPRVVTQANAITLDNAFSVPVTDVQAKLGLMGRMTPFRVRFPLMLGTGLADELIPTDRQLAAAREICRAGNKVTLKTYADARHSDTLTRSTDDAIAFARDVLARRIVVNHCTGKI